MKFEKHRIGNPGVGSYHFCSHHSHPCKQQHVLVVKLIYFLVFRLYSYYLVNILLTYDPCSKTHIHELPLPVTLLVYKAGLSAFETMLSYPRL